MAYSVFFAIFFVVVVPVAFVFGWRLRRNFMQATHPFERNRKRVERSSNSHGFLHVVYEWMQAKKEGVCPLITFKDE